VSEDNVEYLAYAIPLLPKQPEQMILEQISS